LVWWCDTVKKLQIDIFTNWPKYPCIKNKIWLNVNIWLSFISQILNNDNNKKSCISKKNGANNHLQIMLQYLS